MQTDTKSKEVDKQIPSVFERSFAKLTDRWANRLPEWLPPNQITAAGLIMGLLGAVCFALGGLINPLFFIGAILGVFCHLLADNFDGFVARKWNKTSKVGAFYDIMSDLLVGTACLIAIGLGGYANFRIALFLVPLYGIYFVIVLHSVYLTNVFPFPRMGSFEIHATLIMIAILNLAFGTVTITLGGISANITDIILLAGLLIQIVELSELSVKLARKLKRGELNEKKEHRSEQDSEA